MEWETKNGRIVNVTISKYYIDWHKPAPSKIAQKIKDLLYDNFRSHVILEELTIPRTRLRVDFIDLNSKIAIEVNGKQHQIFTPFFHGSRTGFLSQLKRDDIKRANLELNGFVLIDLYDDDFPINLEKYKQIVEKFRNL